MNSIYEKPRTAPAPCFTQKVTAAPTVPDVSVVFQDSDCNVADSIYLTYNAWKLKHQHDVPKENQLLPQNNKYLSSKHVRFESPTQKQIESSKVKLGIHQSNLGNNNDPIEPIQKSNEFLKHGDIEAKTCNTHQVYNVSHGNNSENVQNNYNKFTNPLEQIYMSNIPNRHLDLSIIDAPISVENKENSSYNANKMGKFKPSVEQENNNPRKFNFVKKNFDNFVCSDNVNHCQKIRYPYNKTALCTSDPLEKNRVIDLYNYKQKDNEDFCITNSNKILDNVNFSNIDKPFFHHPTSSGDAINDSYKSHIHEISKTIGEKPETQKSDYKKNKCNAAIQTEVVSTSSDELKVVTKSNSEPTVKDLLKIIQQQNEQLLMLQKQVATMLTREVSPQINSNEKVFGEKCKTSTQLESQIPINLQKCLPKKGPLPQFSVDVMTSFEVSIRRQQNLNRRFNTVNHQPKICEVTEIDSNVSSHTWSTDTGRILDGIPKCPKNEEVDVSLTLNEPLQIRETCPSPENTVKIDMEDYSSDSSDDDTSEDKLFYKNVKGQVNQILRQSGIWPRNYSSEHETVNSNSQNVRRKVKEATIKHLQNIGVHVPDLGDDNDMVGCSSSNNNKNYDEISFAVKQLLPNDQLASLAKLQQNVGVATGGKHDLIKRRPEFSFATVQYMQKYNLLTDVPNVPKAKHQQRQDENFDRILDVTAIKQQPKLL